jgi:hypothetical protein
VLEGELTFELGARGRDDHGLLRWIRRRAAAGSPLVPQRQRPPRALVHHPRTRRGLRRLHARARDGVEVEWDIYTVPARGGLPASEAIVSPDVGRERLESGNRLCWLTLRLGERSRAFMCWGAGLSVGVAGLIEADVREIARWPHRSGRQVILELG